MPLPIVEGGSFAAPAARRDRYSLRVSVLEQCQLQCRYCLPGSVTAPTDKARWLQADEYAVLAELLYARGVKKVRFTGGEPTLRPDLADVVAAFARSAPPDVELALTTNGLRLPAQLDALADAGLSAVTIHLDTLREGRYGALMGEGSVQSALAAVTRARQRFERVKLNVVVQRGRNDDELLDFLRAGHDASFEVRFIELMNTGSARGYVAEVFISGQEIVDIVRKSAGAHPISRRHHSDPAALWQTDDGQVFGVIASDTEPFCTSCDRLRLTADGRLRGCLYQPGGVPLGATLKAGAPKEALAALIDGALDDKRSHHPTAQTARVPFSMADVGG